jgi:hypothetical protein
MDDKTRTARIEDKIDTISDKLSEQSVHLAEIKKDLAVHIKRTDILEHKVLPVIRVYNFLGGLVVLIGILAGVAEILGFFNVKK